MTGWRWIVGLSRLRRRGLRRSSRSRCSRAHAVHLSHEVERPTDHPEDGCVATAAADSVTSLCGYCGCQCLRHSRTHADLQPRTEMGGRGGDGGRRMALYPRHTGRRGEGGSEEEVAFTATRCVVARRGTKQRRACGPRRGGPLQQRSQRPTQVARGRTTIDKDEAAPPRPQLAPGLQWELVHLSQWHPGADFALGPPAAAAAYLAGQRLVHRLQRVLVVAAVKQKVHAGGCGRGVRESQSGALEAPGPCCCREAPCDSAARDPSLRC